MPFLLGTGATPHPLRHDRRMLTPGRRCVGATRFHHRFRGDLDLSFGPLELRWEDGEVVAFDIAADWTLKIFEGAWPDPFAEAPPEQLRELEAEVGIWLAAPVTEGDSLGRVIGQTLEEVAPERNEMGELSGARLAFESVTLRVFGWEGNLRAEVA